MHFTVANKNMAFLFAKTCTWYFFGRLVHITKALSLWILCKYMIID